MESSLAKSDDGKKTKSQKMLKNLGFKKKLEKEEKPFKCKKCPKKYANSGTLHRHKAVHSERKNFKCEVCGKEFKTDVSLRGHKTTHLEKTFQCSSCPILFKGTKQLKLDPTIYESLQKEKVSVGDVIYIEANSGAAKRIGRSDAYATEFDLEAEEYVPLPKVCNYCHARLFCFGKRLNPPELHTFRKK